MLVCMWSVCVDQWHISSQLVWCEERVTETNFQENQPTNQKIIAGQCLPGIVQVWGIPERPSGFILSPWSCGELPWRALQSKLGCGRLHRRGDKRPNHLHAPPGSPLRAPWKWGHQYGAPAISKGYYVWESLSFPKPKHPKQRCQSPRHPWAGTAV